ncbi:MAG: prepilin-type N-terminal cleavage/methylation domain-containing protein [Desulfobacteraceae bacterium]|jgi:general secretion pathway protein J
MLVRYQRGFTLIEILTAVLILAIVVSLILNSFDGIFSSAEHINTGTDLHEMGNACVKRMTNDLKSIHVTTYPRYKPPDIDDEPEIYHVKGQVRNVGGQSFGWLRFTSMAHLPFNQQPHEGIAEIVYYVQQTPENDFILRRADKLYPYPEEFEENETDPILCEQVRSYELVYFDAEGREYEEWDSESDDMAYGTPSAIGFKVSIGTEETNHVFSTRVALPVYRYKPVKR